MKGTVYQRCGCKDEDGRPVRPCPRLARREAGHGRWWYRVRVDPSREERKGGFRTKREASEALAKVVASLATGTHTHDEKRTVAEYLTRWLADKEADGLRSSSLLMYRRYCEQDIVPALGRVRLGELRPAHVDRMLRDLRAAGRGDTTRRRIHATLRSALGSAQRAGLIYGNPAANVSSGGARPGKVRPWEPAELGAFLDHASSHRLGALFEVMAFAGLRRGEACALRWRDVDLDRGLLVVRTQLVEVGGRVQEGRPKTHSGEDRRVDIGDRVVGALLAHRLAQDAERAAWGPGYRDDDRVFAREDGTDLLPSAVTKLFGRLTREAGLRQVRLHDLRHGAASLMLASGADLAVVSKRMGHSSIRVTADIYSHLLEGVGRRVADAAEALVPTRATVVATGAHTSAHT